MKVLITGGAGFIGSHLCRLLSADGQDVTCYDKLDSRVVNPFELSWMSLQRIVISSAVRMRAIPPLWL